MRVSVEAVLVLVLVPGRTGGGRAAYEERDLNLNGYKGNKS